MTNVIDKDTANDEFDRFVEAMDLDLDTAGMDAEDLTALNKQKTKVINALQNGALVINDAGEAVYTPRNAKSKYREALTFHERTGASLMASDGQKKGRDVAKTYAILGDMCQVTPKVFAGLMGSDIKLCEALFALLMD